jgi:hypothetical protein
LSRCCSRFDGTRTAFTGTDANAPVAGDIAMLETEVTPVRKVVRKNGLDVVAIHHHMTGDGPMVIFLSLLGHWSGGEARVGVQSRSGGAREAGAVTARARSAKT